MARTKNGPESFSSAELKEAVRFYEELLAAGRLPKLPDFKEHFRCNGDRGTVLLHAAEFAVKIKAKGI